MKFTALCFLFLAGTCSACSADETTAPVTIIGYLPWDGVYTAHSQLAGGTLSMSLLGSTPSGSAYSDVLCLDYAGNVPTQVPLLRLSGSPLRTANGTDIRVAPDRLERPGTGTITGPYYLIMGEVKYENVAPGSYLEMWNHIGAGSYFSRTLAGTGMLESLGGSSDWRPFWLPFDSTGSKDSLRSLEVNLHLNGPGKVMLRNLTLGQVPIPIWLPRPSQPAPVAVAAGTTGTLPHIIPIVATVLLGSLAGLGVYLLWLGKRRQHERELRRIASLDS